jgi:polysaccharide export outer membrane protein
MVRRWPTLAAPGIWPWPAALFLGACLLLGLCPAAAQSPTAQPSSQTTDDWNQRLRQLTQAADADTSPRAYHIGAEDLLEISVYEAPDLNRSVRVSDDGTISFPLLGTVQAAGLTPPELEIALQALLRHNEIIKDPHVGVLVSELQSRPVSVFGAVKKPGVFQIRNPRSLLEILSLAEGLAPDAGDSVIVMRAKDVSRAPQPTAAEEPASEDEVPGDVVKVTRDGVFYVVGEVNRPGGFVLANNKNISVLQALAMAEGFTQVAKKSNGVIIRTSGDGTRTEIPVDLDKMLKRQAPDTYLQADDIVFVPGSGAKSALLRTLDIMVRTVGITLYRPPAPRR